MKKMNEQTAGDFVIRSDKYRGQKPVVLQNDYNRPLNYFGEKWNPKTAVPFVDKVKLDERSMPGKDVKYPYLTVSDFLESYLIEVPYAIDENHFFIGNPKGFFRGDKVTKEPSDNLYLLPLKTLYFEFFNIKDLMGAAPGGRPIFRFVQVGLDAVRAELLIPVEAEGEYIKFERLYKSSGTYNEKKNEGVIKRCKFTLGFLPFNFIGEKIGQRVGFLDADVSFGSNLSDYRCTFMEVTTRGCRPVESQQSTTHSDESKGHGHNVTSRYFLMGKKYDLIEIEKSGDIRGLILPLFRDMPKGHKKFTFAIDFRPAYTHVGYSVEGGVQRSFDIDKEDQQLIPLFDRTWGLPDPQLRAQLERELIPFTIGEDSRHQFPIRTVTAEIKGLDHLRHTFALGDINIPFHYEKEESLMSEKIETNLKWTKPRGADGKINANRVEKFIETLMVLIRNKVLLNGGDLNKTDVIWFYPSSMRPHEINQYQRVWKDVFEKQINPSSEPIAYLAAEAPFYSHPTNMVKSHRYPAVNIDIGDNTTDIVIFFKDQPEFITSFEFAKNVVFGDGYREDISTENGFVQFFKNSVEEFLDHNKNELHSLNGIYDQLIKPGACSSSDLMDFLFSTENHQDLKDKNLQFKFSEEISNHEEFKIVFLVFYGAIIYHIASLMKKLGYEMPRTVCLSGIGSKTVNLLDPAPKLDGVAKLGELIFEKVYIAKYHKEGLQVVRAIKLKEATCKGGILKFQKENQKGIFEKNKIDRIVLLGDESKTYINNLPNKFQSADLKYEEITKKHKKSTLIEIEKFVDTLFNLNDDFNFEDNFGIATSALREYKSELLRDIEDSLIKGLSKRLELSDMENNVEETLFFYPLVASLYHLTQVIAENN